MLVVFIIDSLNSLIVKDFNPKTNSKKILRIVSNPFNQTSNRVFSKFSNGGSSLMAKYRTVAPGLRVRFSPAALFKTTKYLNQNKTR